MIISDLVTSPIFILKLLSRHYCLQSVLYPSARQILLQCKSKYVTLLTEIFPWCPASLTVKTRVPEVLCKTFHGGVPPYL